VETEQRNAWARYVRAQDLVWLLLFAVLAVFGPERTPIAIFLLLCLALFHAAESRVLFFSTERGAVVSIVIKLLLGYLLIGFTGSVASSYYFILLLPVVSAATTLGLAGTTLFIVIASAAYLSFLLFLDWEHQYIPADQLQELMLRVALLPVVGFLTHQLAEANRVRALNYQAVAEQLVTANQNLQEAEAAVRRADRLAALGQLTAGLAHEVRNPLSTIRTSAEMLTKTLPVDSEVPRELAGYIRSEVDRTNSLITRFLEFARPVKLRLEVADLAACIDRAVAQVERHTPELDVKVFKNFSPDVRPFPFDGELLERVFYNLLLNAAQASGEKGVVTVKTRQVDGEVEVSVIDRGEGIDPKHIENIFNPFFTTKREGVGLGLAIVSKIVDEHRGRILVESTPREGSVFLVYLPAGLKEQ
jgi:two-component system, NtrC family, sensor histidine kinase HydH